LTETSRFINIFIFASLVVCKINMMMMMVPWCGDGGGGGGDGDCNSATLKHF